MESKKVPFLRVFCVPEDSKFQYLYSKNNIQIYVLITNHITNNKYATMLNKLGKFLRVIQLVFKYT